MPRDSCVKAACKWIVDEVIQFTAMSHSAVAVLGIGGLFIILLAVRSRARNRRHTGGAEERLRSVLKSEHSPKEYTFQGLYEAVEAPSPEWLALAIARTFPESLGWHVVFRVVFPEWYIGFSDFTSLQAIPDAIEVNRGSFVVEPSFVKTVFKNDRYRDDDPRSGPTPPSSPSKGMAAVIPKSGGVSNPAAPPKPARAPQPVNVPEPVAVFYE
jgi:hypothetical protein